MNISFIVNPIFTGSSPGFSPWDKRIGGSEEFVVEVSKRLAKKHEVQVFHNGQHGEYEGVQYKDHSEFEPGDVTINVNYPQFLTQGKSIFWTSLTEHPDLSQFEAVCVISEYARKNTGVVHDNIHLVPPGYDPKKIYPGEKVPKQVLYASSPTRGLQTLEQIWPSVAIEHPDANLIVTYGGAGKEYSEDEMSELFRTSDIWVHPASGGELYSMSGVKAQVAGCVPVYFPTMALAETVQAGIECTDARDMYNTLVSILGEEAIKDSIRQELATKHFVDWEESTDILENILKKYN